jgi:nucleotide-binding universal stress UspA family protein
MTYEPTSETSAPYAILVALTFDETGVNALREATRIAELHPTSQLHVLHVVSEIGTASTGRELLSAERRLERAPGVMRQYVEHVWSNLPRKVIGHLRVGVPARSIVQTAADINAELVVVGTHRRSGMKRLVQGSVAAQVVAQAHCPVFIAMPKDYSSTTRSETAEAPCPRCADVRRQSGGEYLWCPQHARPNVKPLVYRPTKRGGAAAAPPPPPRERAR